MRINCHPDCGACCTAVSISSSIPGMPNGKPAGIRCIHLDEHQLCRLFGKSNRPAVCGDFQADTEVCGDNADQAAILLAEWERLTAP
ncbi:MAG: YkgJ family cysteine cluster protein [Pseudomonadales bacterium]|nr:YkgJ family cysteine cluster protein [Pseudomonadales bacterium]